MNTRALFIGLATAAAVFIGACNCGGTGVPCTTPDQCDVGELCGTDGFCAPDPSWDGGGDGSTDGSTQTDGSTDASTDGSTGCVGLECQQYSCQDGGTTTLTGSVYDPSGTVPLYNAVVYVPNAPVQDFTPGVRCETCGASVSGSPVAITLTGPDGGFVLRNVPAGPNIPLVVQVGRWRRQVTLPSVPACEATPITDVELVRLPKNQSEGDLPQMAIATGDADPFECLLRKIGISDSEFTRPDGGGRVHMFNQCTGNDCGLQLAGGSPPGTELYNDPAALARYDVVLLPCEAAEHRENKDAGSYANLAAYTNAGGRVFLTHYGYVWVTQQADATGWKTTAAWNPDPNQNHNPPNPFTVTVERGFPKGNAFAEWLYAVGASTSFGTLSVVQSRNDVNAIDGGSATRWLYGSYTNNGSWTTVQHLTFNTPVNPPPAPDGGAGEQCGRVVFSDFHVTTSALTNTSGPFPQRCRNNARTAQEKALVFKLFDLSACVQDDDTAPGVCGTVGVTCTTGTQCCSGLACMDASGNGQACSGGSCVCDYQIN